MCPEIYQCSFFNWGKLRILDLEKAFVTGRLCAWVKSIHAQDSVTADIPDFFIGVFFILVSTGVFVILVSTSVFAIRAFTSFFVDTAATFSRSLTGTSS